MIIYRTKEEALAAVTRSGSALRHASGRLKDDKDVVLAADNSHVLRCVHSGRFIPYGEALSNGEVYRAIALLDNIPDDLEAITISN